VAPLVFSEIGSNQNLHIRMLTSFVRHLTVLHHPILGFEIGGEIVNWDDVTRNGLNFADNAYAMTAGRISSSPELIAARSYNPVGYQISAEKRAYDIASGRSAAAAKTRGEEHSSERSKRVA
jgi:hypothetical protein